MKKIISYILILSTCGQNFLAMDKKPSEDFIKKIVTYATISQSITLISEGRQLNITTDDSGKISATISDFLTSKLRHSVSSPTKSLQTITLNTSGTIEVINHNN